MIEAENASFTYQSAPSPALQDVTLTVQPGECVVLCGRSGCGKTTFTHLLNGLSPEFYPGTLTGRCTAAGLAAGEAAIEAYVPQVGSVFQNPKTQYFNVDTTAELAFPCENAGMEPQAIRRRVDEVVEQFRLGPLMDRSVFKLSGGEKQRVAFAAACMLGPRLLVLDEPTSNLDAAAIAQLHDMIAVMKRQGVTVVLAEHRLAWITDLADRYFFFAAGRLAAQWSAAEFAALPADTLAGYGLRARTLDDCRAGIRAKQSARCPGTPVLTLEGVTLGCDKKHPLRTLPDMSFAAGEIDDGPHALRPAGAGQRKNLPERQTRQRKGAAQEQLPCHAGCELSAVQRQRAGGGAARRSPPGAVRRRFAGAGAGRSGGPPPDEPFRRAEATAHSCCI